MWKTLRFARNCGKCEKFVFNWLKVVCGRPCRLMLLQLPHFNICTHSLHTAIAHYCTLLHTTSITLKCSVVSNYTAIEHLTLHTIKHCTSLRSLSTVQTAVHTMLMHKHTITLLHIVHAHISSIVHYPPLTLLHCTFNRGYFLFKKTF